jgi:excisionase family DNA binding protein
MKPVNKAGISPAEAISVRVPQAVQLTGMSRSRIYELMKDGEIEFVKVGNSTLIPTESLRRFIDRRRAMSASQPGRPAER